jgi:ectoine hydroxylase-related dioxygenase (phytanoyl-CoA dioxygenase family)
MLQRMACEFDANTYRTEEKKLKQQYDEQGYVIVRRFFDKSEMGPLIAEIKAAKTRNGVSGLNVGQLTFYSNVFFYSQPLQRFVSQPRLVDLLKRLTGPDFWVRWDQAVAKGPGASDFGWHQDNGYSRLYDAHCQLWIALSDMTVENGGLWIQPGSHKALLPHKWIDNHCVYEGTPTDPMFVEAEAGDIAVFSSFMLHTTKPNVTQQLRWAYVVEYMSLDHYDPSIAPPYFVVARDGKPKPEFVDSYRGAANPINRLKYVGFRHGLNWPAMKFIPRRLARSFATHWGGSNG